MGSEPQGSLTLLLDRFAHRNLEGSQEGAGGERPHPFERLAHLRPVALGPAGAVERLPYLLDKEVDERARDAVGMAAKLLGGGGGALRSNPKTGQLGRGAQELWTDHLNPPLGGGPEDRESLCPA